MAIGNCFITHLQILISCFQDNQDSEDVHGFIQGQKRGMYRRVAIGHYDPYPWKITLQSPLALNWMQSNYNTASLIRPKGKCHLANQNRVKTFPFLHELSKQMIQAQNSKLWEILLEMGWLGCLHKWFEGWSTNLISQKGVILYTFLLYWEMNGQIYLQLAPAQSICWH